jgi:hypothetical protein
MILVFLLKSGSVTLKTVPVIVDIITQYSRTEVPREVDANTDPALAEDASVARTTAPTFVCEAGAANGLVCGDVEVVAQAFAQHIAFVDFLLKRQRRRRLAGQQHTRLRCQRLHRADGALKQIAGGGGPTLCRQPFSGLGRFARGLVGQGFFHAGQVLQTA